MDFKDYYATLGVAKGSSDKELKAAYRKLARKHHPDVNPGDKAAETKFKEINEAYEVLGDPEKRKKYDELGSNWRMYEQAGAGRPGAGGPQGGGWNVHFDDGSGFRTVTRDDLGGGFGEDDPFSDFFHAFFGGAAGGASTGAGGRARAARRGRDVQHALELGLEDAYRGTTRRLGMTQNGQAKTVDVRIPAGVSDGSRVRVAGEGEPGTGGAPAGDLYLQIQLAPHPTFERKGKDLTIRVPIPLTVAVLGGEAEVPTLGGKTLRLKIPALTQNAQVFRLKGHGMPTVNKPDETGDLYATAEVNLPRELTPEQRELFEALAKSGLK